MPKLDSGQVSLGSGQEVGTVCYNLRTCRVQITTVFGQKAGNEETQAVNCTLLSLERLGPFTWAGMTVSCFWVPESLEKLIKNNLLCPQQRHIHSVDGRQDDRELGRPGSLGWVSLIDIFIYPFFL